MAEFRSGAHGRGEPEGSSLSSPTKKPPGVKSGGCDSVGDWTGNLRADRVMALAGLSLGETTVSCPSSCPAFRRQACHQQFEDRAVFGFTGSVGVWVGGGRFLRPGGLLGRLGCAGRNVGHPVRQRWLRLRVPPPSLCRPAACYVRRQRST